MTSTVQRVIVGIAVAGLLALAVLGVLAGAAVYGWKSAQRAGDEAATLQNMKTIAAVEIQYYNTHNRTFGTFDQLINEQMLTSRFSGDPATKDGYVLTLKVTLRTSSEPSSYTLNADPLSLQTGRNHFYADSSSASIRVNPDHPAGPNDPPLPE